DIGRGLKWQEKRARKRLYDPPQRAQKPRQPPACAFGVPICSTNSSLGASSSTPGSSGGRTIGMTGGIGAADLERSARARSSGVGAACDSGAGAGCGDGAAATSGAAPSAFAGGGALSCVAGGAASAGSSRGGSTSPVLVSSRGVEGAASIASSN